MLKILTLLDSTLSARSKFFATAGIVSISALFLHTIPANAQLIPDNTLGGENSRVVPDRWINNKDNIQGGARRGSNLFHSFREFNVNEGRQVYFNNPPGIQNILTRVTGSNISNIFGTLGVEGNANLYLINPNGIVFGDGAFLDINGTFIGTTADGIRLGKSDVYSATDPGQSSLLTIKPGTLFVERKNALKRAITNQGNLQVKPGANIILSADEINNNGSIVAPGGDVFLEAINGDIHVQNINTTDAFNGGGDIFVSAANGAITVNGTIDASGGDFNVANPVVIPDLASIQIANSGNITLLAEKDITLSNDYNLVANGLLGGNIKIESQKNILAKDGSVGSSSIGNISGKGGNIELKAKSIELNKTTLASTALVRVGAEDSNSTERLGGADTGNITVIADSLRLLEGASIGTLGVSEGNAGNLTITAKEIEIIGSNPLFIDGFLGSLFTGIIGIGNGGSLSINTESLRLVDGAVGIWSFTTGNPGNLIISAENIELIGTNPINVDRFSRIFFIGSLNLNGIEQNDGNITIATSKLKLSDGATIQSSNLIDTDELPVILISILSTIGLNKNPNISIEAEEIILDRGRISASGNRLGGGDIKIDSSNFIRLQNESEIGTNVAEDSENPGGNITINTPIILNFANNNRITATAKTSTGGNINIGSKVLLGYPQFLTIDATSSLGLDGRVNLEGLTDEITKGSLINSPSALDAVAIMDNDICAVNKDGEVARGSSFTIIGKGGMRSNPLETVDRTRNGIVGWSDRPEGQIQVRKTTKATAKKPSAKKTLSPAVGWYRKTDGTVVLTDDPAKVRPLNMPIDYPDECKKQ